MNKRVKFEGLKGEPIDLTNFYKDKLEREQKELEEKRKEEELEKERINKIEYPLCKSTDKIHHIKRNNNGIIGSGYSSWITDEYFICKGCGIHYNDITKSK